MSRRGLLFSLSSAFLVSVCSFGAKWTDVPVGEIGFVHYCILLVLIYPLLIYNKETVFPHKDIPSLFGLSVFNCALLLASYQATRMMPLADEALLAYTSIAFTVISARFFLGEACGIEKVVSTCAVLLGVVLITGRPVGNYPNYIFGCLLSFIGALSDTASYIFVKKLTHLHYSVIVFYSCLCCLILTFPMCFLEQWTFELTAIWVPFVAAVQEILVTIALSTEQAGVVCLVHAADIVFSYFWEILFYDEDYTALRITGSVLITASIGYTAVMTESDDKPKEKEIPALPKTV